MHAALTLIVSGAEAWTSSEALATAGHGPEALAGLEAAGLVERWDVPAPSPRYEAGRRRRKPTVRGLQWTLTPLAAYLLGVSVDGPRRWKPRPLDVTLRRPCRVRCAPGQCRLTLPELVPDTAPGPELMIDPVSEKPVRLLPRLGLGAPVVIDRRLRGKRGARRAG